MVNLKNGNVNNYNKDNSNYVRPVRLSQRLTMRYFLLPEYLPVLSGMSKKQAYDSQRSEIRAECRREYP